MINSIIQTLLKLKFAQDERARKRNDKECTICLTPNPNQSFFVYRIQSKEKKITEKRAFFLWKKGIWGLIKKRKEGFFNCFLLQSVRRTP